MEALMSDLTKRLKTVIAPLKRSEERQAVRVAVTHVTAGSEGRLRYRVLGTELNIEKPPKRGAVPQRLIRVLIADYSGQCIHEISVDHQGRVVQSEVLHGQQPPFHPDEIREAKEIAERDRRVARTAKQAGAFASAFPSELGRDSGRRTVGLHYLAATRSGGARPLVTVAVDLCGGEIVAFRDDGGASDKKNSTTQAEGGR